MDDAVLVRGYQTPCDLQREIRGSRGGQRTARKRLAQRFAVEQLGDEIGLAILVAGIVHDYDIRMIQRPRRPRFPLESADMVLVVLAVEQHLDRDLARQAFV